MGPRLDVAAARRWCWLSNPSWEARLFERELFGGYLLRLCDLAPGGGGPGGGGGSDMPGCQLFSGDDRSDGPDIGVETS